MALRWTALAVQLCAITNKAASLNIGYSSQLRNSPLNFRSGFTRSIRTSAVVLHVIPEPGACPKCQDENGYWDGSNMFACIGCGHEWPTESVGGSSGGDDERGDDVIRDSNGNILENGDTVVLTKELGKGLKKGLKIRKIRIGDYGDGHDVEASIPKLGTFALKSQFLKKTK